MGFVAFLPGAGGDPGFWQPVGDLLPASWEKLYFGWPGAGDQPHDPAVRGFDDLVARVAARLDRPTVVVAQSMGGVVAMRLALAHPEKVSRLVLAATSGGVDVAGLGASDWRPQYRRDFPDAAPWILTSRPDHSADLGRVCAPTLLLWARSDPLSPLAVGERLASLLPDATLRVIESSSHSFVREHADEVAPIVFAHITPSIGGRGLAPRT
jgi:pimeloyl-ACP methyl ester carboxylesterase